MVIVAHAILLTDSTNKHMRTLIISIAVLLLAVNISFANTPDKFSESRQKFLEEMETFLLVNKQKETEKLFKIFKTAVTSNHFSDEEFDIIVRTSNSMIDQKLPAKPYFINYLKGTLSVKKIYKGNQQFVSWHNVLKDVVGDIKNRKFKNIKGFLAFSHLFFTEKTLRFSKSGTSWYVDGAEFEIRYADQSPQVLFKKTNIKAIRKKAAFNIQETTGTFFPLENTFIGKGGKVEWGERHPDSKNVYCMLGNYTLDTKKSIYKAKKAELFFPKLFPNKSVIGTIEDKVSAENKASQASYPRFESDEKILVIENFADRLSYKGGFKLHGTTLYGYGTKEIPCELVQYDNSGQKLFYLISQSFTFKGNNQIVGQDTETMVYFGQDHIYHPSATIKYFAKEKTLSISLGKEGRSLSPFYDSFHKMNIYTSKIDVLLEEGTFAINRKKFKVGNGGDKVRFESIDAYSEKAYRQIQAVSSTNPIALLKAMATHEEKRKFTVREIEEKLNPGKQVSNMSSFLIDMMSKGFIIYYPEDKKVEILDKVFHYAEASQGKKDYDHLEIISESEETNAFFKADKKEILVEGVKAIEFSPKQKVAIQPFDKKIILKENRDMEFDGKMYAGFTNLIGKDFHFDYDKFHVKIDSLRYLDMFVPKHITKVKNPEILSIGSRIEHARGVLLIDAATNRSGKEDIKMFPAFESKGNSFVFYDKKETQDSLYSRDSFYFKLDKFSLHNLDDLTREDLKFKGKFFSTGTFPEFEETLVVQEHDQSLGFETETPANGFSAYADNGNFNGKISVSNKGILGKGKLKYSTTVIDAEDYVFLPEETTCSAEEFVLNKRKNNNPLPQVKGEAVNISWKPYQDSMYVASVEKPFEMFEEGKHQLIGNLTLTSEKLEGAGTLDWDIGTMKSKLFTFGEFEVKADTTDLQFQAKNAEALAFDTKNIKADVQFNKKFGSFESNSRDGIITLPYNQYITTLRDFDWDMANQTITFNSKDGKGGLFTSIHPEQDSLSFEGQTAYYELETNSLKIGGVEVVEAADALIQPTDGNIVINAGGAMQTLNNVTITASAENKYHIIKRATVDIRGKEAFEGKGFYQYNLKDKQQEIAFNNILGKPFGKRKKQKIYTQAKGSVKKDDQFFIDTKTQFRGDITLNSQSKNLGFDGFAKLNVPTVPNMHWFHVECEGDKNDLAIAYDTPKNIEGINLYTGIYLSKEVGVLYPRVLMPKFYAKDRAMFEAKGLLKYKSSSDEFVFGDSTKIASVQNRGNIINLNNANATVQTFGKFNFDEMMNPIKIKAVGKAEMSFIYNPENTEYPPDSTNFKGHIMTGIDIPLPEILLKTILVDIQSSNFDTKIPILNDKDFYINVLPEFIEDPIAYSKAIKMLTTNKNLMMPEQSTAHTFLMSGMDMQWDALNQSFFTTTDKINLISLNGANVNNVLTGYLQIKLTGNGNDRLYFYLKSPSGNYYYFGFNQGILNTVSNNPIYNEAVIGLKKKERVIKLKGDDVYEIQVAGEGTPTHFVNRIKFIQSELKK